MESANLKVVGVAAAAFVLGCLVGGSFVQWKAGRPESRTPEGAVPRAQAEPVASRPEPNVAKVQAAPSRSVTINGQRLNDWDIQAIEATYRVQVRDGNYWYDRMNGSWGAQGGPTAGFIMAGLNLGGPLREDASNGDTGVFINGRQLHQVDVARLSQIGPVHQGRCWMDAAGNIGLEGQPAFGNIWLAVQALAGGGKREGILSTYDKTGVAVFGY